MVTGVNREEFHIDRGSTLLHKLAASKSTATVGLRAMNARPREGCYGRFRSFNGTVAPELSIMAWILGISTPSVEYGE